MKLQIFSLYSGSSGNAFLIGNGSDCLLIDGGKNCKRLCASILECGYTPEQVRAVLVTHEHSDHVSALPVFLKKYQIPAHAVGGTAETLLAMGIHPALVVFHPSAFQTAVGGFSVTAFSTPHDSLASVGYRVETMTDEGICRVGYATDMGKLTAEVEQNLTGCNYVILESNHDVEMLKNGGYPFFLKKRILGERGHLSNGDCASLAGRLAAGGTQKIMLAHLSRENNTPALALAATAGQVEGLPVEILVADPEKVTVLV